MKRKVSRLRVFLHSIGRMIDGTQTAKTRFQSAKLTLRDKYLNYF